MVQAKRDLDAVHGALLFTKPSTVLELVNLLDAPLLRQGITENRVRAALFLLREHGLAKDVGFDTRNTITAWLRVEP
jgi:hypothetical protein